MSNIIINRHVTGVVHGDLDLKFQEFLESWTPFCREISSLDYPVKIISDFRDAIDLKDNTPNAKWHDKITDNYYDLTDAIKGVMFGRWPEKDKDLDLSMLYIEECILKKTHHNLEGYKNTVAICLRKFIYELSLPIFFLPEEDIPQEYRWYVAAYQAGFIPLAWHGKFPKGYMSVYCPPGLPQCEAFKDSLDPKLAEKILKRDVKQLRKEHSSHPDFKNYKVSAAKYRAEWLETASATDLPAACRRHFQFLAADEDAKQLLDQIAETCVGIAVHGEQLHFKFDAADTDADTDADGEGDDESDLHCGVLRCAAPYQGKLPDVPKEVYALLAMHNGMDFEEETFRALPFATDRFVIDYADWYDAEEQPSSDPWSMEPIHIPFQNEDGVFMYHPTLRGEKRRAVLCEHAHDGDGPGPIECTLHHLILEHLAYYLGLIEDLSYSD